MAVEIEQIVGTEAEVGDAAVAVLNAHADGLGRPFVPRRYAFVARDHGAIVGRIMGAIIYDWAYLRFLAVADDRRGSGVGAALLARFEEAMRAEGALGVMVDTFAFQAPDFYARRGYAELGRLEAGDPAQTRIYFKKALGPAAKPAPR